AAVAYWLVIAMILPPSSPVWPSVQVADLRDAVRSCYPEPPIIAGYSEPSAVFLMGSQSVVTTGSRVLDHLDSTPRALAFVERKHKAQFVETLQDSTSGEVIRLGCISARNVFTSRRWHRFEVYARPPLPSDPACIVPARYRCAE